MDNIKPKIIWDSHSHLDIMEAKLRTKGILGGENLNVILDKDPKMNSKIGGVIINFANPDYWAGGPKWNNIHPVLQNCWSQEKTFVTLGCHHFG